MGRKSSFIILVLALIVMWGPTYAPAYGDADEGAEPIVLLLDSNTAIAGGVPVRIASDDATLAPFLDHDTTYVPLRFLSERLGAWVIWDAATSTATVVAGERTIRVTVGASRMEIDGNNVSAPPPLMTAGGTTCVPLRAFAAAIGYEVAYAERHIAVGHAAIAPEQLDALRAKYDPALQAGMPYVVYQNDTFLEGFDNRDEAIDYAKRWNHSTVRGQDGAILWDFAAYEAEQEKLRKYPKPTKTVYLTFDDGPSRYTGTVLNLLKDAGGKATFFMLAGHIKSDPDIVKRMVAEGHAVGLHGVTHVASLIYRSPQTVLDEMQACNDALEKAAGVRTKLIRVPFGSKPYMKQEYRDAVVKQGYRMWDWNVDSYDSRGGSTTRGIVSEAEKQVNAIGDGAIVLFHDTLKQTVDALPDIVEYLRTKGYAMKPLDESMTPVNFWKDTR